MKRFVQHSVGKRAWKAWLQEGSKGCPVTPTDEAFVLVVLENAWDVWINLFEQFGGVFRRQKRALLSPEKRIRSNKKFKYTSVIMSDQESEEGEDPTSTTKSPFLAPFSSFFFHLSSLDMGTPPDAFLFGSQDRRS